MRLCGVLCVLLAGAASAQEASVHRVYTNLLDPREHPDYDRRHVKPPTWDTFGGRTRFTALRGFPMEDGRAVRYAEEMEKYALTYRLGDVLWPSYDLIFASNLGDVADEIAKRGLYLFDIWGYVPGSGPGGYWQQFHPPAGVFDLLESKLGERWFGMDIGEQDGRYIGGYAPQMYPISDNRFVQYLNFQRHFQRMTEDLGNRNSALVSLNYGHYFLKEGVYTLIGAETAQGLPNGQVYYSFIRGAGKQYGVPWFGNASIWNRWGYKSYDGEAADHGPTQGTSLSLLKRLIYDHILYNCVFVGFEAGWFQGEGLSPVGRIQQSAVDWVERNGQPGTMVTPVALLVDFLAGWTFPRHLYTQNVYRVWGNIPFEAGDYFTDGVLNMLYPGYEDSSFYHDERGFLAPTPYGDIADCLLTDAPLWLLERYPVLVVAGEVQGGAELRDKLQSYVEGGGTLLITAGNLAKLPGGLAGVAVAGAPIRFGPGDAFEVPGGVEMEPYPFELIPLRLPPDAKVVAALGKNTVAAEVRQGRGRVVVSASPFGLPAEPVVDGPISDEIDKPLLRPYPLLEHMRFLLDLLFREQRLFEAGDGLSLITCRKGAGEYTLGITNNALEPKPFAIVSHCGPIEAVEELSLDQSEKGAVGYLPTGREGAAVGVSDDKTIAGGDVRVFRVRVREEGVEEIPHRVPPPRPRGRVLPLRDATSVKEAILARPTFFEHFDSVAVDWRYLRGRDSATLAREAGWLARQGLRVYVDATSGTNLYPDLRLVNNDEPEFAASMAVVNELLAKMAALGSRDLILSLHRTPENNFTGEQTTASFESTLRDVCSCAEAGGIAVYLRADSSSRAWGEVADMVTRVGAANLRVAAGLGLMLHAATPPDEVAALKDRIGLWLAGASAYDAGGALWTTLAPLAQLPPSHNTAALLAAAPDAPVLLDAAHKDADGEYCDAVLIEGMLQEP